MLARCGCVAVAARSAGEFGRWLFEVTVVSASGSGNSISIGWDVPLKENGQTHHVEEQKQHTGDEKPAASLSAGRKSHLAAIKLTTGAVRLPGLFSDPGTGRTLQDGGMLPRGTRRNSVSI